MANISFEDYRIATNYTSVSGVIPTVPTSGITDIGDWSDTDIMVGEIYTNTADARVWFRSDIGIHELGYSGQTGNFLSLSDCPSTYVGENNKWLRVNSGATGLEFFTYSGESFYITTAEDWVFTGLTNSAVTNYSVIYDNSLSGFTLSPVNTDFINLSDVEGTDYGDIYNLWRTNSAQTGLESFVGSDTYVTIGDVQTIMSAKTFDDLVTFNNGIDVYNSFTLSGLSNDVTITDIQTGTGFTCIDNSTLATTENIYWFVNEHITSGLTGLTNFVTLDTTQTITGIKTFSGATTTFRNIDASKVECVNLDVINDITYDIGSYQYFGDPFTNGSFRIYVNVSGALVTDKREAGSWVFKSAIN